MKKETNYCKRCGTKINQSLQNPTSWLCEDCIYLDSYTKQLKENKTNEGEVEPEKTPWWAWCLLVMFVISLAGLGFRIRELFNVQSIAEVYCENGKYTKTTLRDGETLYIDCREHYTDYTPYNFRIGGEDF